ncbi:MAG: hypothetical protein P8J79_02920 [Halioglobus sp.]|nr:hypothetical protein [Halioglobus sp.]
MIKPRLILPLLLALSPLGAPVAAQSVPTDTPQAPQEPTIDSSNKSDVAQQATASERSPQKKAASTADNNSPFDYRSSEKISEDVPVSFPVDI